MNCDLCVRTAERDKALEMGRQLGLGLVCLVVRPEELPALRKAAEKRDWRLRPRLAAGADASSPRPDEMRKLARRLRKRADVIVVKGGTDELNRAAVETPEVDILMEHEVQGRPGINHVLARLAKSNGVHIAFDYNKLVTSYRLGRIQGFSSMVGSAREVRKARAPFVLTSGAMDPWGMRSGSELLALGKQMGFTEGAAMSGVSDSIVRENRKRLSGSWVMPGVEVEREE